MLDVRAARYLLRQRGRAVRVEWMRRLTTVVSVNRLSQFHSVETSTTQCCWSLASRGNICHRFSVREARLFCFVTDTEEYYSVVVSACLMLPDRRILTSHSRNSGSLLSLTSHSTRGPGNVVGIATGYGLDGPGIESRWGRDIPHPSRPAVGPTQSPVQWVPSLSRG